MFSFRKWQFSPAATYYRSIQQVLSMSHDTESFSFQDWQDAMNVADNPVENKMRRDWLGHWLRQHLDGYEPKDDSDQWEFLAHYADQTFLDCLALHHRAPVATLVSGRFRVNENAGWGVPARALVGAFHGNEGFEAHFQRWLQSQRNRGIDLKQQLLSTYCHGGEEELRAFAMPGFDLPKSSDRPRKSPRP